MTIGDYIRKKQPREYAMLLAMCVVVEVEDTDKALREIERLMGHDGYRRERGAVRQVRRG